MKLRLEFSADETADLFGLVWGAFGLVWDLDGIYNGKEFTFLLLFVLFVIWERQGRSTPCSGFLPKKKDSRNALLLT